MSNMTLHILCAAGSLTLGTGTSTAQVDEGNTAIVCFDITSSATALGCDLTVTLSTVNGKAEGS